MRLEELQPLLDRITLTGSMPSITLRMKDDRCRYHMKQSTYAHAHARFTVKHRGWLCFSQMGLDRAPWEVIATLAHELAHFRFPSANHNNQKFIQATKDFFEVLTS